MGKNEKNYCYISMTKIIDEMPNKNDEWKHLECWHELLNAICLDQDYVGNSDLAYRFCQRLNKDSQKDMETVTRNISNWRSGANLPSRKHFRLLSDVLKISSDKELEAHWNDLYRSALQSPSAKTLATDTTHEHRSNTITLVGRQIRIVTLFQIAVLLSAVFGAALFLNWYYDDMRILAKNSIIWRQNVTLTVGEKVVVHGKKGKCGELPPTVEEIIRKLPKNLVTGTLTTGELGLRASNRCNGLTPAREIVFEARAPGQETFFLFGNDINVQVTSEPGKEDYTIE